MRFFVIILIMVFSASIVQAEHNSYIIKFKSKPGKKEVRTLSNNTGIELKPLFQLDDSYSKNAKMLSSENKSLLNDLSAYYTAETDDINALSALSNIERIEPDLIYRTEKINYPPNDAFFEKQWGLEQINIEGAWKNATGRDVVIGFVDTGIEFDHPDLLENLRINNPEDINMNGTFEPWHKDSVKNGASGDLNGIDDDGNGYIDDVIGYDLIDQKLANFGDYLDPDPIPEDEGEHGTIVAGVAAATADNEIGIAGVAPNSKILTARAFDATGNGEASDISAAIIYAALNGADIINMSFGEDYYSPLMHDAIKFADALGCVMVASSGNNNWYFEHYPSDLPEVISVGGSDETGRKFGKSNYGSRLDIIAPGLSIQTTITGKDYGKASGTSLSAPFVSGVAALLLETDPDLSPAEIKGILKNTAQDVEPAGWDVKTAAGILDAEKALKEPVKSRLKFISPQNRQVVDFAKTDEIKIKADILNPLFNKYEIMIGKGYLPSTFDSTDITGNVQVKNGVIGTLTAEDFSETVTINGEQITKVIDTLYTISLKIELKNKKTVEERVRIKVYTEASPFTFLNVGTKNGYFNNERQLLLYANTSREAEVIAKFRPLGSNENFNFKKEYNTRSKNHLLRFGKELSPGTDYEAELIAVSNNSDTIRKDIILSRRADNFTTDSLNAKPYTLHRTYLHNGTADLLGDGRKYFSVNDLSQLGIGNTIIYTYDDGQFLNVAENQNSWICKGFGDSNNDGITEFFGTGGFKAALTQRKNDGESPFKDELFSSDPMITFWGEKFYDIDKDGADELIGFNDSAYFAYKYDENNYRSIAVTDLPDKFKGYGVEKGSAIGDMDGDGNIELAFPNNLGFIYIYEFVNGGFRTEFIDSSRVALSNQYMTHADINGDGKPEILHLSSGSRYLFKDDDPTKQVWLARVYGSTGVNEYDTLWSEVFYGVRAGYISRLQISYRNGVAAGDLDSDGKEEIVISAFPNLYVFTYKDEKMQPFWYNGNALSNSAMIADIDGNGINELAFSGFNRTRFFEYSPDKTSPGTPAEFTGRALSDSTAYFSWNSVPNAELYQIYSVDLEADEPVTILQGATLETEITVDSLQSRKTYYFAAVSYNSEFTEEFSDFSELAEIYTHNPYELTDLKLLSQSRLKLFYNGKLPYEPLDVSSFEITDSTGKVFFPNTALSAADTSLILTFNDSLAGGNYNLKANSFPDYYNTLTLPGSIDFNVETEPGKNELYLKRLELLSKSLIKITFSEPVRYEEAVNIGNYEINPYGEILYAEVDPTDSSSVQMNLSQFFRQAAARGFDYTITAGKISSKTGKPMTTGPGNTLGFVVASSNLDYAYVYPNPIKLSDEPDIYFANLTSQATVEIQTLDGQILRVLEENDGNGGIPWDGRDDNGKKLDTGIYLFKVSGTNSKGIAQKPVYKKFAIIP